MARLRLSLQLKIIMFAAFLAVFLLQERYYERRGFSIFHAPIPPRNVVIAFVVSPPMLFVHFALLVYALSRILWSKTWRFWDDGDRLFLSLMVLGDFAGFLIRHFSK